MFCFAPESLPLLYKPANQKDGFLSLKKFVMKVVTVVFKLLLLVSSGRSTAQTVTAEIKLNQLGFYPAGPKIAVVNANAATDVFSVLSTNGNDTVYRGRLGKIKQSANSATKTRLADFSSLGKKGTYYVYVRGLGNSYPFSIHGSVHQPAAVASLKGFYYQRVSMPLEEKYAGKWKRAAGHPDTAVLIHPSAASPQRAAGSIISTPGGWYDAGDYNKYIVNSGISMGTLLSAYEDFPAYFDTLKTNIPESGDAIPDILNEVIYNLRWMLAMQDPNDGGVYNKNTNAAFDGMVMPGITKAPRYVVAKSTPATLDFAAVTAQAARILKQFDKTLSGLSDSCLSASVKAWKWAQQFPDLSYDQNNINKTFEPKITTGAYGDRKFTDERFWAAVELLITTGDELYVPLVSANITEPMSLPTWGNVQMLGNFTLLRHQKQVSKNISRSVELMKKKFTEFADEYVAAVSSNAFATVMGKSPKDFNWGSNSNAANQGIILINAYLITNNKKYADAALSNLDYILGRNATGYSFLTGIGSKTPMHPHHRPSVADGIPEPVPGLLAGGPNPGMQDRSHYDFTEPETAYTDVDDSYASNEIAINWNAPLVYLANAIENLY
jgi:endoglucanase